MRSITTLLLLPLSLVMSMTGDDDTYGDDHSRGRIPVMITLVVMILVMMFLRTRIEVLAVAFLLADQYRSPDVPADSCQSVLRVLLLMIIVDSQAMIFRISLGPAGKDEAHDRT